MDQPLRTKQEARELLEKRFNERIGELAGDTAGKVKQKYDEWITDDALNGLIYAEEHGVFETADDWFDGAVDYLSERSAEGLE